MMKTRLLLGALIGVSVVAVAASAYAYRARESAISAWAAYTQLRSQIDTQNQPLYERAVRADAGLPLTGTVDPAAADAAVRDYIHRTNVVGSTKMISGRQIYEDLGSKDGAQLCGGMSLAQAWAMRQMGIPARYVTLGGKNFISGEDRYQTHAVAEVFYAGDWHISDPTFNISVDCTDGEKHMSVQEAFACIARGGDLVGVPGKTKDTGKTLADFAADYSDYYVAYEIKETPETPRETYPSSTWIADALLKYPADQ